MLMSFLSIVKGQTCKDWPKTLGGKNGGIIIFGMSINAEYDMLVVGSHHDELSFVTPLTTGGPFISSLSIMY